MTKAIISDLNYKQKYTSGVLSWEEPPGQISEKILEEVMDSFERMVGAGIESNRLNWLWVLHQDKNRIELHYVIPNCDLQTGKRFSPYFDRVDRGRFRAWERYTNAIHGFTDPSDPAKKRDLRFPSSLPREKKRAIEDIHMVVTAMVAQGIVNGRDDVIEQLQSAGYKINRMAADYISIQDEAGRKLRLRGAFYETTFTNIKSIGSTDQSIQSCSDADCTERITQLRETLDQEIYKRSIYISKRYMQSHKLHSESPSLLPIQKIGVTNDRSAEPANEISPEPRRGFDQARTATDDAIRRTTSAIGHVEHAAAEITGRLTGIERSFAAFLQHADRAFQRLRKKVNESGRVDTVTRKLLNLN